MSPIPDWIEGLRLIFLSKYSGLENYTYVLLLVFYPFMKMYSHTLNFQRFTFRKPLLSFGLFNAENLNAFLVGEYIFIYECVDVWSLRVFSNWTKSNIFSFRKLKKICNGSSSKFIDNCCVWIYQNYWASYTCSTKLAVLSISFVTGYLNDATRI